MREPAATLRRIRLALGIFIAGLVLSGLTAFPLESELRFLASAMPDAEAPRPSAFTSWVVRVRDALVEANRSHPFLAYGTDWLAFAHLVIAVAFLGPMRDPVRNIWVLDFGLIACAGVIPLALIAGAVRGIPVGWRLIDCSFGVLGAVPLLLARRWTRRLASALDADPRIQGAPPPTPSATP